MNTIQLIGRLTRDPEIRWNDNNFATANFTLAVDRLKKGGEKATDFIPVVLFGKNAETAEKYLYKGQMVGVVGRLQISSYEKEGQKRTKAEVIGDRLDIVEWRDARKSSGVDWDDGGFTF